IPNQLAANRLGDRFEQEADRMADQVLRTSSPQVQRTPPVDAVSRQRHGQDCVQRQCSEFGDTSQLAVPAIVHDVLRSPGRALDAGTLAFMEPRFDYDFSRVRVHDDDAAALSARELGADAYTVGHDLVFGTGLFAPGTHHGNRLLAHELAHVTQQSGGRASVQRSPKEDRREHRSVATARQRGRIMAAKLKKEGKFSETSRTQLAHDLEFFEAAAQEVYVAAVRPTLQAVTAGEPLESVTPGLAMLTRAVSQTFAPALLMGRELALGGRYVEPLPEVLKARSEFRARHGGHSDDVLNKIDNSLERVTEGNLALLLAYYRYYATHALTDKLPWNMSDDKYAGATAHGDSDINPDVLSWESKFPTDDPERLLGGTLMHEFSHTPQDNPLDDLLEAKAYGIERFFAERTGDKRRDDFIVRRYSREQRESKKAMYFSYFTMLMLYEAIDKGGPAAEEAKDMSVEFISKNPSGYRRGLRDIVSEASTYYVP
ncbi:MAG: DUF4157 domain-containing protein, partial [Pseudomonadota bacterium]|nr:DUF4157 domain-containing protein [Pseudomonadota bacterium]